MNSAPCPELSVKRGPMRVDGAPKPEMIHHRRERPDLRADAALAPEVSLHHQAHGCRNARLGWITCRLKERPSWPVSMHQRRHTDQQTFVHSLLHTTSTRRSGGRHLIMGTHMSDSSTPRSARRRVQEAPSPGRSSQHKPTRRQRCASKSPQDILAHDPTGKMPPLKVQEALIELFHTLPPWPNTSCDMQATENATAEAAMTVDRGGVI